MARVRSAEVKKRGFLGIAWRLAVGAACVYLAYVFVAGQMQVSEKRRQLEEVDALLQLQTEQNQEMQRLMDADNERAYIERIAREKLGYARPEERIFVDLTEE